MSNNRENWESEEKGCQEQEKKSENSQGSYFFLFFFFFVPNHDRTTRKRGKKYKEEHSSKTENKYLLSEKPHISYFPYNISKYSLYCQCHLNSNKNQTF